MIMIFNIELEQIVIDQDRSINLIHWPLTSYGKLHGFVTLLFKYQLVAISLEQVTLGTLFTTKEKQTGCLQPLVHIYILHSAVVAGHM